MYFVCPFCEEGDYDKVGLKYHLETGCGEYESTLTVEEERKLYKIKRDSSLKEGE